MGAVHRAPTAVTATLRYCMARVRRRGLGLGNELLPWARAFIAAQVLDAKLLPPAFGMNRRGYWRHFHTAPDDWLAHRALEVLLPVIEFTETDYLEHGGGDAVAALQRFAKARALHRRRAFLLVTEGLWGGYYHVDAAREFIRSTLFESRYAARNLLRLRERLDPQRIVVGMHVRLGDFRPPQASADYRATSNLALPLEWFCNVANSLTQALGPRLQFLLVSDGNEAQLRELTSRVPCVTTGDLPDGDCSDALALAAADLLVCSASTYSHLAAFLSDAPYLWFAPNLTPHPAGCYSLGERRGERERGGSALAIAVADFAANAPARTRGIAVELDGTVPAWLPDYLLERHALQRWQSDLVRGGVTAMPASPRR